MRNEIITVKSEDRLKELERITAGIFGGLWGFFVTGLWRNN